MKLHIGNIHESTTESELKDVFSRVQGLVSVTISKDRYSRLSNGFIEFETKKFAYAAIYRINGKKLHGSKIVVNEARNMHNQYRSKRHRRWQEV